MQTITNNVRIAGIALAAFVVVVLAVAIAPKAHAADMDMFYPESVDYFSGGYNTPSYGGFSDTIYPESVDYWSQGYSDYGYGGSSFGGGCSSCGGSGFGGFGGGSGFGGFGGFGGGGSVYAPSSASSNTSIYAPTNTCTAPNSCNSSVDDHSVVNANTTVTVSGGGSSNSSYPVYVPVYSGGYNNYSTYQQPVVYPNPVRQPYVSLSAAPYTGLDLGPVGTVLYWGFLVAWCLVAAYLIVYKRVQTKLVSGLNSFLFGAPAAVGTHAKVVMPAVKAEAHKAYVAPTAQNDDAIDPFIASQIARNK